MTFDLMGESLYNDTAGGIGGFANATAPPPASLPPCRTPCLCLHSRSHRYAGAPPRIRAPRQVDKLQLFFDDREALLTIPSTHSPLIERVP